MDTIKEEASGTTAKTTTGSPPSAHVSPASPPPIEIGPRGGFFVRLNGKIKYLSQMSPAVREATLNQRAPPINVELRLSRSLGGQETASVTVSLLWRRPALHLSVRD
jgi:hypothetical protein